MTTTNSQPTIREMEINNEYAYWQGIYQETVLRSGGPKALAKIKAVLDEIKSEAHNERLQA